MRARAFGWIEQFADPDQPATRIENSDSARTIIEQDGGIGPLFCFVGDACTNIERVFPVPFDQMDSWVLYHESARGSAKVRAVLDALVPWLQTPSTPSATYRLVHLAENVAVSRTGHS